MKKDEFIAWKAHIAMANMDELLRVAELFRCSDGRNRTHKHKRLRNAIIERMVEIRADDRQTYGVGGKLYLRAGTGGVASAGTLIFVSNVASPVISNQLKV